ncbi:MAG: cytochrome-c peroxidase [Bacteroidota bacterium]
MKIWYFFSPFLIFFLLSACQKEEVQVRVEYPDLNLEYFDYFNRNIPTHIARKGRIIIKHENSVIKDDSIANNYAALGRILFYDTQLSKNNLISCATCHQQSLAFADGLKVSTGLFGEKTTRNSMALVNLGFQRNFFWDISGRSLEEDVMKPIQNHIEMGIENLENLAHKLEETYYYPPLFQETFHTSTIEKEHISSALAAFVKSLYTYNSKYDQGVIKNFTNFTRSEVAGMDLFFGKANCGSCHAAPHFIPSWGGVGNIGLELDYEDEGAGDGRFKIPSLRNI